MTVSSSDAFNRYTANGATTVFAYDFRIDDSSHIAVYADGVLQASGFSVSGVGDSGGGAVTFTTAPANGVVIDLRREMPLERATDYQNSGDFISDTVNSDYDSLWLAIQQVQRDLDYRALQFSKTQARTTTQNALPAPVTGNALTWNPSGWLDNTPLEITVDSSSQLSVETYGQIRALNPASLTDGQICVVTNSGKAGDFILHNVLAHGIIDDDAVFIVINADWYAQRPVSDGIVHAEWFGFLTGQGSSFDAAVPFNAASTFVRNNRGDYHTVTAGGGVAHIQTPIKILQSVSYDLPRSNAVGVDGLEFVATPQLAALLPPSDIYKDAAHLPGLVLAKTPMVYNTQLLTHQDIGSICLDANGEDVYGVYINERYFSSLDCVVRDCPNAPITLIYNQFNEDGRHESRECSGPVRYVMCNTTTIAGLDIELCDSSTSCLDIVHSISTKNNVRILNMHYEESDAIYPTGALARFGGRGITLDYGHWTMSTVPSTRYIDFLASATSYSIDSATVSTTPCLKVEFIRQMFTANTAAGRLGTDADSVRFDTTLPLSSLVNNSTVYNHILSDTTRTQLGRQTRLTNSDGTRLLGSTQDNRVNLYSNDTRYFDINGANIRSVCTGGYWEHRANGHRFYKGDGTNLDYTQPLYMFGQFVWIDAAAGAWRRKTTAPTSDTDGTLF